MNYSLLSQINLSEPTSTTDPDKGYIAFGIFSGSHVIELREDTFLDRDEESYLVCKLFTLIACGLLSRLCFPPTVERYTDILISRLYATFAFSLIAMLLCLALIAVTFVNSYQTVTTWWKGPSMMYILSVLTSELFPISIPYLYISSRFVCIHSNCTVC